MAWAVLYADEFALEVERFPAAVRIELLARADVLAEFGPALGRPWVDTLKASAFPNMKEMRFDVQGGVWRVAFAFDPARRAVLLAAANKIGLRGRAEHRFYQALIAAADARYGAHLRRLGTGRG